MPIDFSCPHCGNRTQVADQYAGMSGPCSRCGQNVTVPRPGAAPASPLGPPSGFAPPAAPSYGAPSYPPAGYGAAPSYGAPAYGGTTGYGAAPQSSSGSKVLWIVLGVVGGLCLLCVIGVIGLIFPAVSNARVAAKRMQSQNNLKQIGLAMHNYHDVYGKLPLAGSDDPAYGLNMSWRVRLLPFLEQGPMYNQMNFNVAWNEGNNAQFNNTMPMVYQSPQAPPSNSNTVYVVLADAYKAPKTGEANPPKEQTIFSHDGRSVGFANIVDGTSNTLLVVEADADQSVPWMAPKDLVFDPKQPKRGLGTLNGNGFQAVLADGSVRFINKNIDENVLRNLAHRNDGNPVGEY